MNLFYQSQIPEGFYSLDQDESKHCVKVLRKKEGDAIHLVDGRGSFYEATITQADPRKCEFTIVHHRKELPKDFSIHIAIAPTKNADRIEWFVEKCVELGIDRITLIECENSERSFLKIDRLKKVAISAMKQSLKATLPAIEGIAPFDTLLKSPGVQQKFVAHVDSANPTHLLHAAGKASSYLVLIGPEGDFSPSELELAMKYDFRKVSLGNSRLRTETAGVAACHILNLVNS